jgi:putative component of membrane protein insertase Oxa1/YidC/SpoIIIJ protein YidD
MKRAALALINWYWRVIREEDRQVCLYRVSCSRHVHALVENRGLIFGIRAFVKRMRSCKQGYSIERDEGELFIRTVSGNRINAEDINPLLLRELNSNITFRYKL